MVRLPKYEIQGSLPGVSGAVPIDPRSASLDTSGIANALEGVGQIMHEADEKFKEAERFAAYQTKSNEMANQFEEIRQQSQTQKEGQAFDYYTRESDIYRERVLSGVQDVKLRRQLEQDFGSYKNRGQIEVRRFERGRIIERGLTALGESDQTALKDIDRGIPYESVVESYNQQGMRIDQAVSSGFMSFAKGEEVKNSFRRNGDQIVAVNVITADPNNALNILSDHKQLTNLTPEDRDKFLAQAKAAKERGDKVSDKLLAENINDAKTQALATGDYKPEIVERARMKYGEAYATDLVKDLELHKQAFVTFEGVKSVPFAEGKATVEAMKPVYDGENDADEERIYEATARQFNVYWKALADDPVAAIREFHKESDPLQALVLQEEIGLPVSNRSYFTKAQATSFVEGMKEQPLKNQVEQISKLEAQINDPDGFQYAVKDLQRNGLNRDVLRLALFQSDPESMADLINAQDVGSKMLSKNIKEQSEGKTIMDTLTEKVKERMEDYRKSLFGGEVTDSVRNTVNPKLYKYYEESEQFVQTLAMYYVDAHGMKAASAAEKAADVWNSRYTYVGTTRIPKRFDADKIQNELYSFLNTQLDTMNITRFNPYGPNASLNDDPIERKEQLNQIKRNGKWITNADESGVYLVGHDGNVIHYLEERTPEGRLIVRNKDGSVSTEKTITVTDPGINQGRPTNIPSMYAGQVLPEQEAIKQVIQAGGKDPETGRMLTGYDSINEAVAAAEKRSKELGKIIETPKRIEILFSDLVDPLAAFKKTTGFVGGG